MSYDNDWNKTFDPQSGRLVPKRASSCTVDSLVRCVWTEDSEGCYGTDCGKAWMFTHELGLDGERGDGFRYCPFCGKQIATPNAGVDAPSGATAE